MIGFLLCLIATAVVLALYIFVGTSLVVFLPCLIVCLVSAAVCLANA